MSNVNKSYFLFGTSQNTSFILNHVWLKYKALWCLRRCFLRTLLWAVAKLQYEQVWGFSPVWVNRWRRTWFDRPKILEQTGHENLPLSIFMGSNFASIICNHNNKNCFICKCCTFQNTNKNSGIIKIRNFFLGLMLFQMPGQFVLFMSCIITNLTLERFITNVDFDMPSTISRTTKDLWTERTSKLLHANFQGISLQDNLKKENYQIDVKYSVIFRGVFIL